MNTFISDSICEERGRENVFLSEIIFCECGIAFCARPTVYFFPFLRCKPRYVIVENKQWNIQISFFMGRHVMIHYGKEQTVTFKFEIHIRSLQTIESGQ